MNITCIYPQSIFHRTNILWEVKKNGTTLNYCRDLSMPTCLGSGQQGLECEVSPLYLSTKLYSFRTTVPWDLSLKNTGLRYKFKVNKVFLFCSFFFLSVCPSVSLFKQGAQTLHIPMRLKPRETRCSCQQCYHSFKGLLKSFSAIVSRNQDTFP